MTTTIIERYVAGHRRNELVLDYATTKPPPGSTIGASKCYDWDHLPAHYVDKALALKAGLDGSSFGILGIGQVCTPIPSRPATWDKIVTLRSEPGYYYVLEDYKEET